MVLTFPSVLGSFPKEDSFSWLEMGAPKAAATGSCPSLSCVWCSPCLLTFQSDIGRYYTEPVCPCEAGVDVQRGEFYSSPLFILGVHIFLGVSYLLLQTEKAVAGLLQVRFLFKVGSVPWCKGSTRPLECTCAAFYHPRPTSCTDRAGMQTGIVSTQHLQGSSIVVISSSSIIFIAERLLMCLLFICSSI